MSTLWNAFLSISEVKKDELTPEALRYVKEIQEANRINSTGFVSLVYLHTKLPLKTMDQHLSKGLQDMHSQFQHGKLAPILGFVGVHGNNGFSIDFLPVTFFSFFHD